MVIKYLYALFIGLLFALFIGIGISTFYSSPKPPETKPIPYSDKPGTNPEIQKIEEENRKIQDNYQARYKVYSRNVSMISLACAVIALIISLTLIKNLHIISDGLLTGGIFTLLYSIGMGIASDDSKFRFGVITTGFIISLIIGYLKFVKPAQIKQT